MRLLPVSLICALFSGVVISGSTEKVVGNPEGAKGVAQTTNDSPVEDIPQPTIFNGVEVPPIPEIEGEKFNSTIKDGYWFVKHYS